jgi:hypothetical protein
MAKVCGRVCALGPEKAKAAAELPHSKISHYFTNIIIAHIRILSRAICSLSDIVKDAPVSLAMNSEIEERSLDCAA